jgi:hypothetical protein
LRTIVDLSRWTPIAVQVETAAEFRWVELEGAPMTRREAKAMYGAGRLLKGATSARRRDVRRGETAAI